MNNYVQIERNKRRIVLVMFLYPMAVFGLVWLISMLIFLGFVALLRDAEFVKSAFPLWKNGTWLVAFVVMGLNALWIIKIYRSPPQFSTKRLEKYRYPIQNYPSLKNSVENIAITAGIITPEIFIVNDEALNAYAAGIKPDESIIVLSRGLLDTLNKNELEAVIAHEISHIVNRDTALMMLVIHGARMFSDAFERICEMYHPKENKKKLFDESIHTINTDRDGVPVLVFITLIPLLIITYLYLIIVFPIIRFAVNRKTEFIADANAVLLTRNPAPLAEALLLVAANSGVKVFESDIYAPLCIMPPAEKISFIDRIFSTHPPVAERIKAIIEE